MISVNSGLVWFYNDTSILWNRSTRIHPIQILDIHCPSISLCLWYISPVWQFDDPTQTRYALLGEWEKWTAVSHQRFVSFSRNQENTQSTLTIEGSANELVRMYFYHSKASSPVLITCSISNESGQAQVVINAEGVRCTWWQYLFPKLNHWSS